MAPGLTTETQFTFLISCIRNSNEGKVDFQKVATECDIVSKAAAAKRYERLMKAHGISNSSSAGDTSGTITPRKNGNAPTGKGSKRKLDDYESNTNTGDDDEGLSKNKTTKVKAEGKKAKAKTTKVTVEEEDGDAAVVKPEPSQLDGTSHSLKMEVTEDVGYGTSKGAATANDRV